MRNRALLLCLLVSGLAFGAHAARADGAGDPAPVSSTDGEYFDKQGNPTYNIKGGKVDWYTFIGYRMYGANCLACHGPDALGSSYAPSLVNSLKSLTADQVEGTIIGGKRNVSASQDLVMPAFGVNKNVMCYLTPIYVYLRARSDGAWGRDRPSDHEDKPADWDKTLDACFQ
ncbi:MAG: c-type cytochrome, methanol metabolism-related [Methylocella sp.]